MKANLCDKLTDYLDEDEYDAFEARPDYYTNTKYNEYPVAGANWHQAKAYCEWRGARRPTEAEWEKAARGSQDTRDFPWGKGWINCDRANARIGFQPICVRGTDKVGVRPNGQSPYGAMDMTGNALEWVNDWFGQEYYHDSPSRNPQGPLSSDDNNTRVARGGSFYNDIATPPTVFARWNIQTDVADPDLGFRCAQTP